MGYIVRHMTPHLAAADGAIDVHCDACGGRSKVPAGQALRCLACGAAGSKVRPWFSSRLFFDRDRRPVRLRDLYAAGQELRLWCSACQRAHEVRFATAREIEEQIGAINPTIGEAARYLVCPVSHVYGVVAVAAAPNVDAQMRLPLGRA
jgi:hypothetical protein